jgi:predicted SprT family Zn-dependent metalloprotease
MKLFGNQEEKVKEKTYQYTWECDNCEEEIDLEIPFGRRVESYLDKESLRCESCGCLLHYPQSELV